MVGRVLAQVPLTLAVANTLWGPPSQKVGRPLTRNAEQGTHLRVGTSGWAGELLLPPYPGPVPGWQKKGPSEDRTRDLCLTRTAL